MNEPKTITIRTKFPIMEPEIIPTQPTPTQPITQMELAAEFENVYNATVSDKCRGCSAFRSCLLESIFTGKNIIGRNNT